MNQKFHEDKRHNCTECDELLKKGKAIWLELVEGTGDYFFHGIPKNKGLVSQGWHPFGSRCAKTRRVD